MPESESSKFERVIHVLSALIHIGQFIFALVYLKPSNIPELEPVTTDMELAQRAIIMALVGCLAAAAFGMLVRYVYDISQELAVLPAAGLALASAWFTLVCHKIFWGYLEDGVYLLAVPFVFGGTASLYLLSLAVLGMPLKNKRDSGSVRLSFYAAAILVPFFGMSILAILAKDA